MYYGKNTKQILLYLVFCHKHSLIIYELYIENNKYNKQYVVSIGLIIIFNN